jgi:hypothetical protein
MIWPTLNGTFISKKFAGPSVVKNTNGVTLRMSDNRIFIDITLKQGIRKHQAHVRQKHMRYKIDSLNISCVFPGNNICLFWGCSIFV